MHCVTSLDVYMLCGSLVQGLDAEYYICLLKSVISGNSYG